MSPRALAVAAGVIAAAVIAVGAAGHSDRPRSSGPTYVGCATDLTNSIGAETYEKAYATCVQTSNITGFDGSDHPVTP